MHITFRRVAAPVLSTCLALVVAACGSTSPTPPPAATAVGSAAAGACPTAAPVSNISGWNPTITATSLVPTIISSEQVCGQNRLLFGFSQLVKDSTGQQVAVSAGTPDRTAKVALFELAKDPNKPVVTVDATFMWAIEGKTGVYAASVTYPEAGDWGAEFTTSVKGGPPETIRVRFPVQADGVMPGIGDKVPSVKTPTGADVGGDLKQIATDPTPDPRFYQLSEDQALAQQKPFVLVFATPAFCTSAICGPTLDKIKAFAKDHTDVAFINVEPYKMQFTGGRLQPVLSAEGQLQVNAASDAFHLQSEPFIFVVDGKGTVTGSFEAVAGPDELAAAIAAATRG